MPFSSKNGYDFIETDPFPCVYKVFVLIAELMLFPLVTINVNLYVQLAYYGKAWLSGGQTS